MPPQESPRNPIDTGHMLPPHQHAPAGPMIGAAIIVIVLILGALYFWGAELNKPAGAQNQVPYILSGTTTIQVPATAAP